MTDDPPSCPRRAMSGDDVWRSDHTCSYCGSFNPTALMARLEEETVELGPTDKNYKLYLDAKPDTPPVPLKFYFQHFSEAQKRRFVELLNLKKLHFGYPGYLYTTPFFIRYEDSEGS